MLDKVKLRELINIAVEEYQTRSNIETNYQDVLRETSDGRLINCSPFVWLAPIQGAFFVHMGLICQSRLNSLTFPTK